MVRERLKMGPGLDATSKIRMEIYMIFFMSLEHFPRALTVNNFEHVCHPQCTEREPQFEHNMV